MSLAREVQVKFRMTQQERELLEEKMALAGTVNMGAYLRKMAIDGYVLRLDLPELREMISLLRRCSGNLNQIAKRANESGRIYETDLKEIQEQLDELWNTAKEILAFELTKLVHGEEEANKAQEAARALFGGSGSSENMPATQLPEARFTDGKIGAIELLVACGLCASNGEARRLIQQGGVAVNDQKVASIDVTFDQAQFAGDGVVIKKGKKVFHRAYTA